MAVIRKGNVISMGAVSDTVEGKFKITGITAAGTANFQLKLATGESLDEVFVNVRGVANDHVSLSFKCLPIEDIKVLAKGTDEVFIYFE